jgi:hypothetical protein
MQPTSRRTELRHNPPADEPELPISRRHVITADYRQPSLGRQAAPHHQPRIEAAIPIQTYSKIIEPID